MEQLVSTTIIEVKSVEGATADRLVAKFNVAHNFSDAMKSVEVAPGVYKQYKHSQKVRMNKVMLPNTIHNVNKTAAEKRNVIALSIKGNDNAEYVRVVIPDGNYTIEKLLEAFQTEIQTQLHTLVKGTTETPINTATLYYGRTAWALPFTLVGNVVENRVEVKWVFDNWVTQDQVLVVDSTNAAMTLETTFGGASIAAMVNPALRPNCPLKAQELFDLKSVGVFLPDIPGEDICFSICDCDFASLDVYDFSNPLAMFPNSGFSELLGFSAIQNPFTYSIPSECIDESAKMVYRAIAGPNVENSVSKILLRCSIIENSYLNIAVQNCPTDIIATLIPNAPPGSYITYDAGSTGTAFNCGKTTQTEVEINVVDQDGNQLILYGGVSSVTLYLEEYRHLV